MKISWGIACLFIIFDLNTLSAHEVSLDFDHLKSIAEIQPTREEDFRSVIKIFADTQKILTWGVNRDPGKFDINFILFDSAIWRQSKLLPLSVRDNCFYEQEHRAIVCDFNLIRRFARSIDLNKRQVPDGRKERPIEELRKLRNLSENEMKDTYRYLMTWIIGHEFGHFIKNHHTSHFDQAEFYSNNGSMSLSQSQEMEADQYLTEVIDDPLGKNVRFYLFMLDVMQRFISKKACPDRSPEQFCNKVHYGQIIFPPKDFLNITANGSHPEFLVRLLRLFMVTGQRHQFFPFDYLSKQIFDNNLKIK